MVKVMWDDIVKYAEEYLYYPDANTKLKLSGIQREALEALAEHKVVVVCVPKRQGKTLISAVAALYALTCIPNSVTIILSTSREHAAGVAFRRVKELINIKKRKLSSEYLRKMNRRLKISQTHITCRLDGGGESLIETVPCVVEAVAGKLYDLLIIDELALIADEEVVSVAMSQSEKPNSRVLITSTASSQDHLLYRLYQESQHEGSNIHFIYRSGWDFYKSDECNPLITTEFLETQRKRMIEPLFRRYFLNEFGTYNENLVFSEIKTVDIDPDPTVFECYETYIGIDRALPHSQHGDYSAAVTVHKILLPDGSVNYLVGDATIFPTGEFEEIWGYIMDVNSKHPLATIAFEVYQCYDIYSSAQRAGISTELIHVTANLKAIAFNKLHSLMTTNRLIIPSKFTELIKQLSRLRYKNGRYEAPSGEHDDLVYALVWAIDVATKRDLSPFFFEPFFLR